MGELAAIVETLVLLAKAINELSDAIERIRNIFYAGDLTDLIARATKESMKGSFEQIKKSVCVLPREEYNTIIDQFSIAMEGIPGSWFPAWWGRLSEEDYKARRDYFECPVPEPVPEPGPTVPDVPPVPAKKDNTVDLFLAGGSVLLAGTALVAYLLSKSK